MALEDCTSRAEVIEKFRLSSGDTGSVEVQVALLTQRLNQMMAHSSRNPKDMHSRRGMFKVISRRKRLLAYLNQNSLERYRQLISALDLRK